MSQTHVELKHVDRAEIATRLSEFERTHRLATGEDLSSRAFFDRYQQGELDTLFGMRWAGYVRALERSSE